MTIAVEKKWQKLAVGFGILAWGIVFVLVVLRASPLRSHFHSRKVGHLALLLGALMVVASFCFCCAGLASSLMATVRKEQGMPTLVGWLLNGSLFLFYCGALLLKIVGKLATAG